MNYATGHALNLDEIYMNFPLEKLKLNSKKCKELTGDVHKKELAKDVAEILGCHEGCYRRYENGSRDIPLWALIKLAESYDVNIDYLLGITNNKRHFGE